MGPVEVVTVPAFSSRRSTTAEERTKMPAKPISEQAVSMAIEHKQDDHRSESTKVGRLSVAEPSAANDSSLAEVNPARGTPDCEVEAVAEMEKEAAVTGARVRYTDNGTIRPSLT